MTTYLAMFQTQGFADTFVSLLVAFVLGTIIGAERQYRQRSAGLRTNVLVAVGAASFVDLAMLIGDAEGTTRVISYVVSGVGFLGAGVIMKDGGNIRGLNTAATLWACAAVGACAGADRLAEATLVTGFTLAGNTLLIPLVNAIDRLPISAKSTEAIYEVHVLTDIATAFQVQEQLVAQLTAVKYPAADIELEPRGEDSTMIVARLVSTTVDQRKLAPALHNLRLLPSVRYVNLQMSAE